MMLAGELEQSEVEVGSYLVADPQAFELVEQAKVRSTTHLVLPRPDPWAVPLRAIFGVMPRARRSRRYLS